MGYSKQQLLARLQELQIVFSQYEHPVVLTGEAQDKKHRFYIVSALADTKVDLKVLSQLLGLGKGGLRMAPEEALALNSHGLDKFLESIGRDSSYVDLEANPTVGKDRPPDLPALVPSGSIVVPDQPEKQLSLQVPIDGNQVSASDKSNSVSAKLVKPSLGEKSTKGKPVSDVHSSSPFADVGLFVEEILHKTPAMLLSEIREETIKQHGAQLGTVASDNLRKGLNSDLKNLAMIFKNTAYTEGFHAGIHHRPKHL